MLLSFLGGGSAPDVLTFMCASAMCLIGALCVVFCRNPVHSALGLILTMFGVAVLFVAQEAHFLAAVQVIVYAGAVVVLFLFVIMLLGVDREEDVTVDWQKVGPVAGAALAGVFLLLLLLVVGYKWDNPTVVVQPLCVKTSQFTAQSGTPDACPNATGQMLNTRANAPALTGDSNIKSVSRDVFTNQTLAFEVTSILLVIAVVGTVVLARRPRNNTDGFEIEIDIDEYELALLADPDSLTPDGSESAPAVESHDHEETHA